MFVAEPLVTCKNPDGNCRQTSLVEFLLSVVLILTFKQCVILLEQNTCPCHILGLLFIFFTLYFLIESFLV